ncbi:MAG: DUF4105 domain-containing protein [Bdellovibrionota bacterium]
MPAPSTSTSLPDEKIILLSKDKLWLRLLHLSVPYTKVISSGFYLSGSLDPLAELRVNLSRALGDSSFRCKFPARDQWLRSQFGELSFPDAGAASGACAEYDSWRGSQVVDSISIVYPDRNVQTSLGVFSHTFLKLNLARWPRSSNLNIALGFAAELDPNEPFVSLVSKGLFGGYVAQFTFSNYYTEVNRYGESESRDIFEYDLKFSKSEIDFLLKHMWELQDADFQYYFLSGNCSYHLLTLLEIARPSLDLSSGFDYVTVPSTSLRVVLAAPDLVGKRHWIPGKQTRQNLMVARLSEPGRALYRELRYGGLAFYSDLFSARGISAEETALILDLLAESTRGRSDLALLRGEVLNYRSQLPVGGDVVALEFPSENPETAHGVELISVGFGQDSGRSDTWAQLRYRAALHNVLDPPSGYFRDSTFELADLRVRYYGSREFDGSSFTLLNAVILQSVTEDQFPISWRARSRVNDFLSRAVWENSGGVGFSKNFSSVSVSLMGLAETFMDSREKAGVGVFAGASVGLGFNLFEMLRVQASLDRLSALQSVREGNYWQGEVSVGYSKNAAFSIQSSLVSSWRERSLILEGLYYY